MSRTRLRQLEQVQNSKAYDDQLNMGIGAEGQPGIPIQSGLIVNSFTAPNVIKISGALDAYGLNASDIVTTTGATNSANNGTFTIYSLTYAAMPDETTIVVQQIMTIVNEPSTSALVDVLPDPKKNLRRDLDHIRTQLRLLNQKPNWFDAPLSDPTNRYQLKTGTAYLANTDIVLANPFDGGEPYTLKVFLNGQLLLPSLVNASHVVTASYDYVERDSSQPVKVGEVGDRVRINFDIVAPDVLQFKWEKQP